jgi:hypothetical protein
VRLLDVRDFEMQNRTWMIEIRSFRNREHQSDSGAVEECHFWRHGEKMLHAERLFIEDCGALEVMHVHGNLADLR